MVNATHTPSSSDASFDFKLYRYDSSLAAAIVGAATFGVVTCLHIWRVYRTRALHIIPLTIGGLCTSIAVHRRQGGEKQRLAKHPPSLPCRNHWLLWSRVATFRYVGHWRFRHAGHLHSHCAGPLCGVHVHDPRRLVRVHAKQRLLFLPVTWITRIFVLGDVVSFTLQGGGGGIQAGGTLALYQMGELS